MSTLKVHPAAALFPLLDGDDLRGLVDNIREHGLREAVVVQAGVLLDGRNRLVACELAGVEPRFQEWGGEGSPIDWIVSTNLHRRHMSVSDRARLAVELLPQLEAEARERMRLAAERGKRTRYGDAKPGPKGPGLADGGLPALDATLEELAAGGRAGGGRC